MARPFTILSLFFCVSAHSQGVTVSGTITEQGSAELLPYVSIVTPGERGTQSNSFGYYAVSIPGDVESELVFTHVGYKSTRLTVKVSQDTVINIALAPFSHVLSEVVIESYPSPSLSLHHIPASAISNGHAFLGEQDMVKSLQLLPGVQRGVEASNTFYVRGGGADQNLIIVDDATVYNANHLFGFISVFNTDAIRSVSFYKGSFPARYGGRVASVTDIRMRDGSREKIRYQGGIGLLSGRITVDGPLGKSKKSSFLFSGRRSFLDLLTAPLMSAEDHARYRLFDVHAKINTIANARNRFFLSVNAGGDRISTSEKATRPTSEILSRTTLGWINRNGAVRWNRIFSNKVFANTTLIYSHYNFFLDDTYQRTGHNANLQYQEFKSGIDDYSLKSDVDFFVSNTHSLKSGIALTHHSFVPRMSYSRDDNRETDTGDIQRYNTFEGALYVEDHWEPAPPLSVDMGLRTVYLGARGKDYVALEPRLHFYYSFPSGWHLNAGYTRTNQFMHLLSNTGIGLPTDLWVPVTAGVGPQQGDQFSAGVSRNLGQVVNLSVESYRRHMRNIISYHPGAVFLDLDNLTSQVDWEENIATGKGVSYGTEFLAEKKAGRVTGQLAYTLSWVVHQFRDINDGKRFFPAHDSRHNVVVSTTWKLSGKVHISASWMYASGRALTVPHAYLYGNFAVGTETATVLAEDGTAATMVDPVQLRTVPWFGDVNSYRAEAYHRLDVSVRLHRKKEHYERYWEFGLFNAYNRRNPFYYYLESSNDFVNMGQRIDLRKKSLFPILPSISYNFKF